jgi:nucleotide-binding universal stress UspA family protein
MIAYKNIIVGVNFTESSTRALLQAHYLGKEEDAVLSVVHCLDVQSLKELRRLHDIDTSPMVKNALKKLKDYTVQVLGDDQSIEFCVLEGDPHRELVAYAERVNGDLLVLGSNEYEEEHSKNGIFSIKCIREASMPILLVKNTEGEAYQNVIAYTDLSDSSSTLIAHAAKQSLYAGGKLDVVNVVHPPWMAATHVLYTLTTVEVADFKAQYRRIIRDQLKSMIRDAKEYLPITINPIVLESESCAYRMIGYLWERDAGLVVIGKTGKGGYFRNHPLGTTAEHIVRKAGCSVLVIPQPEEKRVYLPDK